MAKNETMWHGKYPFVISTNDTYSFGFSGWQTFDTRGTPIYDDFAMFVWQTRKAAGFDEPMPEPIGYKPLNLSGQILFSGQITVPQPKVHRQIKNICGDSDGKE